MYTIFFVGLKRSGARRMSRNPSGETASGQNKLPPSKDRWKIRSATYKGIADAMAAQWGHA